jgi:hypothetical protein
VAEVMRVDRRIVLKLEEKKNTKIIKLWVRTGYGDLHGELSVAEDGEQSGDARDNEGQDDGEAGVLFGLEASEDEEAGANDHVGANLVLASSLDLHELRVSMECEGERESQTGDMFFIYF